MIYWIDSFSTIESTYVKYNKQIKRQIIWNEILWPYYVLLVFSKYMFNTTDFQVLMTQKK